MTAPTTELVQTTARPVASVSKAWLRALVPHENAVAGLDLGEKKQALAVAGAGDHVLARPAGFAAGRLSDS